MDQTLEQTQAVVVDIQTSARVLQSQVLKYLVAGATAAALDLFLFHWLATSLYPCVDVQLGDDVRSMRFAVDKTASFLLANALSYFLNVRWVFVRGRHSRIVEIILFFSISTISYLVGMQTGRTLIANLGLPTHAAAVLCIGIATALNFTFRKLLVFRR